MRAARLHALPGSLYSAASHSSSIAPSIADTMTPNACSTASHEARIDSCPRRSSRKCTASANGHTSHPAFAAGWGCVAKLASASTKSAGAKAHAGQRASRHCQRTEAKSKAIAVADTNVSNALIRYGCAMNTWISWPPAKSHQANPQRK